MAPNPLLAILFCTSSASGSNLAWCWPPKPKPSIRLGRPRPAPWEGRPDISWRAAHDFDNSLAALSPEARVRVEASLEEYSLRSRIEDYEWRRPGPGDSHHYPYPESSGSRPSSNGISPMKDAFGHSQKGHGDIRSTNDYGDVLGYPPHVLAEVLTPKRALCHQKFELFVDELAFLGHPVHIGTDGNWDFHKVYEIANNAEEDKDQRGRSLGRPMPDDSPFTKEISLSPELPLNDPALHKSYPLSPPLKRGSNSLSSFHLVLVLDRPDPSSVASSDVYRFIDVYYRQIAFKLTAAMHHEQGRVDFVGQEASTLIAIKETCITQGDSFETYIDKALRASSLASAIQTVYESVSCDDIAHININEIPVHVQLPPNHISFLHGDCENEEDQEMLDYLLIDEAEADKHDAQGRREDEIQYGWRLPPLLPWKALVLLDVDELHEDEAAINRRPNGHGSEEKSADDLYKRFTSIIAPTLSLSDIAALLDMDLDREFYPMARGLIYHRKAKVIDVVNSSLKNIYAPPAEYGENFQELCTLFARTFPPPVPPMPSLLNSLSSTHRAFSTIVPSPDHRSLFTEVLVWLLKRDLLVMLHVRVRIVATANIKTIVREARRKEYEQRRLLRYPALLKDSDGGEESQRLVPGARGTAGQQYDGEGSDSDEEGLDRDESSEEESSDEEVERHSIAVEFRRPGDRWDPTSNEVPRRKDRSRSSRRSQSHKHSLNSSDDESEDREMGESDWDEADDDMTSSLIPDPARATPLERRWLKEMAEGKHDSIRARWQKTLIYFDGKKTTDEILFRTEMSRQQLREVLHHFEEYLIVFLHP